MGKSTENPYLEGTTTKGPKQDTDRPNVEIKRLTDTPAAISNSLGMDFDSNEKLIGRTSEHY